MSYDAPGPAYPPAPWGYETPAPTGLSMKRRNVVGVWIGLPIITLGIYSYVWYYKIHAEMARFDPSRPIPVAGPVLVLLLLSWTIVAPLVSYYNTGDRIRTPSAPPACRQRARRACVCSSSSCSGSARSTCSPSSTRWSPATGCPRRRRCRCTAERSGRGGGPLPE